jgi:CRISPR-associated protein Csx3
MLFEGGEWRKEIKMNAYKIEKSGDVLKIGFGSPAQNDEIVRDAVARLDEMTKAGELTGGKLIKINGPASLPVAVAIAHGVSHLYEAVAVFDPKLGKYVVSVSHSNNYRLGDLID